MRPNFPRGLFTKAVVITAITLVLTAVSMAISETQFFRLIFPETIALEDFEYSDFAFSRRKDPPLSRQVVLVNMGTLSRDDVARQIVNLENKGARVIGIDAFFQCPPNVNCEHGFDSGREKGLLSEVFQRYSANIVLTTRLFNKHDPESLDYDSLETSDPKLCRDCALGFANLRANNEEGVSTTNVCRTFPPSYRLGEALLLSFGAQIVSRVDPQKLRTLLERDHSTEIINYRGNLATAGTRYPRFPVLDANEVLLDSFETALVKGKIVLMGYLGNSVHDTAKDDMFFTPLNETPIGKSLPDMSALAIHANIVEMLLNEDYIDTFSSFQEYVFAFVVALLHAMLLLSIHKRYPRWFELAGLGLIILQLALYSFIRIALFIYFDFKIELGITIGSLAIASLAISIYQNFIDRNRKEKVGKEESVVSYQ